jgi:hypothetical protein
LKRNYKRRQFKILDPAVQKDIYYWLASVWIGWVVLQSFFALYFVWLGGRDLLNKEAIVVISFFIFSTSLFLILLVSMNHFVNKFLGPIYKIRMEIDKAIKENKDINIQLRKDDYFQDVAEHLNNMKFKN